MERSVGKCFYWCGLLISACAAVPGAALAADNGFYVGLASSDVSSDYGFTGIDADDDRGLKGIVGFRPLDSFAIEANYVDLGETTVPVFCVTTPCQEASIETQALSVSAVGMLALPLVDLYARVGLSKWETDLPTFGAQEDGSDPTYGAGAQVRVGSFALRLEYERFDFDENSADLVSIGFTYTFL
jgi:hypothetical protein